MSHLPSATERLLTADEFSEYFHNNKSIPKYESSQEQKLPHAYWNLDTSRVETLLSNLSKKLSKILEGTAKSDRELHHLLGQLYKIDHYERKQVTTIALVGPQGSGKSMLIQALFEVPGLSLTGKSGSALTSTIIKYAQYSSTSRSASSPKYFAEVQFHNETQIAVMLRELVKHFHHCHNDSDDTEDEPTPGNQSFQQDELDRKYRDTAEEVFITLCDTKKEFLNIWASVPKDEFVRICHWRCKELFVEHNVDNRNVTRLHGDTPDELMSKLKPFIANVEGVDKLWPLVDYVTIRFDHELLRNGAIIVDVPGTGDTNMSRSRRAEEIKDTADILMVLGNTERIATTDTSLNIAENCIINRGFDKVKLVATQIDNVIDSDLSFEGDGLVKQLIEKCSEDATLAMKNWEPEKMMSANLYGKYLQRYLLQRFVTERSARISSDIGAKLNGRSASEILQVFHISAHNSLQWVAGSETSFHEQPPLPPSLTGIPEVRQYLFSVLAPKKYNEITTHAHVWLPNFIEKIKRVTDRTDRHRSFATAAKSVEKLRDELMPDLLAQAKRLFRGQFRTAYAKAFNEIGLYKQQVDKKIRNDLFGYHGMTWSKILKFGGTLPPRASKAKGLEDGCSYNKEFSNILASAFNSWGVAYLKRMEHMDGVMSALASHMHFSVLGTLNNCDATIMVIEAAKRKWGYFRKRLSFKAEDIMPRLHHNIKQAVIRATMEDGRQNSLIADVTDKLFDKVLESRPDAKPASNPKKKPIFVEPKIKYQKKVMEELFLDPKDHFVDKILELFKEEYTKTTNALLDNAFGQLQGVFDDYIAALRSQTPIDYKIEKSGEVIRAELGEELATIVKDSETFKELAPDLAKSSDDSTACLFQGEDPGRNLANIFKQLNRKRKQDSEDAPARPKRERCE